MSKSLVVLFTIMKLALWAGYLLPVLLVYEQFDWVYYTSFSFYLFLTLAELVYFTGTLFCSKPIAINIYHERKQTQRMRVIEAIVVSVAFIACVFFSKYSQLTLIILVPVIVSFLSTLSLKKRVYD